MSTPLFLLLGLTIATCVIAYWADNLGKKLGKKRVTLFGLRPRQTATLITMASSVVIMFFTLATLLIVNSGLRRSLFHYDEERADNKQLRGDNKQLRDEQQELKSQRAQAQQATAQARKQAENAQKATIAANRELGKSAAQLKSEQAKLKMAQSQEKLARASEKTAQSRAGDAGRRLVEAKRQLTTVEGNLRLANANLQKAQVEAKQAQEGAGKARNDEKSAKDTAREAAKNFVQETKKQLEEVKVLEEQQKKLKGDIADLTIAKEQLRNRAFDAQLGVVFAARTLAPRLSASNVATQMRDLLGEGERVLKSVNPNRTLRLVLPDDSTRLAPDDILDALVRYLATFSGPVSVRLTSTRNHAEVETEIHAALMPVSARLVFPRDENIVSTAIEGRQSDARVFNQLLKLLNRGEALARDRGVSPLLKGDELFYSADTNERIFETLRHIQAANATVTVRMIADTDISAIDQLRVRFEVVTPEP